MNFHPLKGMSTRWFPGTFQFPIVIFCVIQVLLSDMLTPLHLYTIFVTN